MGNEKHNWDYSVFWNEAKKHIKSNISEQEWLMWFINLKYDSSKENQIILNVPSLFYRDQIKQRYINLIEKTIFDLTGQQLNFDFIISKVNNTDIKPDNQHKTNFQELSGVKKTENNNKLKLSGLNPKYTFSSYVIGENNTFAANAALAISKNIGSAYNPFLVYGGVGLGKTHLIQSIGNVAHLNDPSLKILYITAETFTDEFIKSIRDDKKHLFKNKYRNVDLLMVDDIHFLQGKDATQEELFHTFNTLYDSSKQMVFTCDRPVSELRHLKDRLQNRFERGLNVDLQPPNYETRFAIIKKKSKEQNIQLPENVIELICNNITSNIRDLESSLTRLIAYADLVKKEITLDVAKKQLKDAFIVQRIGNVSVELIQKTVSEYFNISSTDIKSKRKQNSIVLPRQIAMYITRKLTEMSTTEIGAEFGGRDHTTVMHSCQKIESRLKIDSTLDPTIKNLIKTAKEKAKNS